MVIDAVEMFASRTAKACVELWNREEIEKRAVDWPAGYDDKVADEIEKFRTAGTSSKSRR